MTRVKKQLALRGGAGTSNTLRSLLATVAPSAGYLLHLLVKDQRKLLFVIIKDILYFEADHNYITLHTATKPPSFMTA